MKMTYRFFLPSVPLTLPSVELLGTLDRLGLRGFVDPPVRRSNRTKKARDPSSLGVYTG